MELNDDEFDFAALMKVFLVEAEENVSAMEQSLLALETAPGDEGLIATVFRAAHTLKGTCASVGLDSIVGLAHAAEDLLHELRARRFAATPELITLLLRAADALKTLIPQAAATPESPPVPDASLVEALRQAAASGIYAQAPAPASSTPAAAAVAGAAAPVATTAAATVRVPTRKLDLLLDAMSELNIARGRVRALCPPSNAELNDGLDHLDQLTDRIQDLVLQTRMVRIGPVLRQQVRTARDLATRVGKQVIVEIDGEDVELDISVMEHLRDPLTHMVRNAVDHGIEPADARTAQGKPAAATISLRASHHAGTIVVEIADDGRGIDVSRLRERARAMQIEADTLSERDLLRLILLPGFSTATSVTEVSGRGIGLDVVEKNVSALGGSIGIRTELGRGTTFTLRLPLTVAVLHGLAARVSDELYIIPLPAVSECLDLPAAVGAAGSGIFTLRGEAVPFLRLRNHLGCWGRPAEREKVVVVEYDHKRAGLVVDDFIGETRAVVKPVSRLFRRAASISGSALLGTGEIGLVLEVASIVEDVVNRTAVTPKAAASKDLQ